MRLRAAFRIVLAAALLGVAAMPSAPSVASAPQALAPIDVSGHFRIMALGDSITAGVGSSTGDGYRWDLARYLVNVQQAYTADYVGSQIGGQEPNAHHEGHSGWRIDELSAQAAGWVTTYQPDVVLLDAGTNDTRQGADASVMADRMAVLLGRILAASPTVRIVVADLIPPWYGTPNDVASVAAVRFNSVLPGVVAAAGPRVSLARMSAAVPSNLLADGLHPGDDGYGRMAWVWWRCMGPLLAEDGVTRSGMNPLPVPIDQAVLCPR